MTLAWQVSLPHPEKLLLLALADNANDEGICWPSVKTLTEKCGMEPRSIQRIVGRLADAGHLTVTIRPARSNYYTVHPDGKSPRRKVTPTESHPDPGSPPPRPRVTPDPDPGSPPEKKKTSSLEPSVEPSLNHHRAVNGVKKPARARSEEPPPSNLNVEAWHRWEQYRREIRRPIKPVSVPAAQRKLAGFGADQGAVVEQSIANGWQGLFDLGRKTAAARGFDTADEWRPTE